MDEAPDPLIGQTLGEFEILELIGRGGMGAVYKARQPSLERLVAIKVLSPALSADEAYVARFTREARAAAAVSHRHIIGIIEIGQAGDHHYIAMEYLEGESLAAILDREGRLPPDRALAAMKQAAAALAAAHKAGIIHRDIKPSNLMLDAEGEVRITDFGLAKRLEGDVTTTDGRALGTPAYVAPEMATGRPVDGRTDLYCLGATFFHALAGRPPFEGDSFSDVLLKQVNEPAPPLRDVAPDVDSHLCEIVDRLLRKDPAERPPSAQALLAELAAPGGPLPADEAARAEAWPPIAEAPTRPLTVGRPERPRAIERLRRRRRAAKKLAIVGALATAAVLLVVLRPGVRPRPTEEAQQDYEAALRHSEEQPDHAEGALQGLQALEREWPRLEAKIPALLARDRFGEAFRLVDAYAKTHRSQRRAGATAKLRQKIRDQATARYQELARQAEAAIGREDYGAARAALEPVEGWDIAELWQRAWKRLIHVYPRIIGQPVPLFDGKTLSGWSTVEQFPWLGGDLHVGTTPGGRVHVEDGWIVLEQGRPFAAIRWAGEFPTVDYEVSLEASPLAGSPILCKLHFPVGSSGCALNMGTQGGLVGLMRLDGLPPGLNDTGTPMLFGAGRYSRVRLRVTKAKVEAWIDGQKVVDLPRAGRRFSPSRELNSVRCFALGSVATVSSVRNIKLLRLQGEAETPPVGGSEMRSATVVVGARVRWFDTGLFLTKGKRYEIAPSGRWGTKPESSHGAEGDTTAASADYPLLGATKFCLLGRLGTQGRPFWIRDKLSLDAPTSARLHLRMNDDVLCDNWGSLRVAIRGPLTADPAARLLDRFRKVVRKLDVDARSDWTFSGLELRRGAVVLITADGTWNVSADPTGGDVDPAGTDHNLHGHRLGALTGRIGRYGEPFTIGTLHLLEARQSGKLYLAMHDHSRDDNTGSVAVTIWTSPQLDQLRRRPAAQPDLDCDLLATLEAHRDRVLSVDFSPDGTQIASSGADRTVKLWDAATGQFLRTLPSHGDKVECVRFSPDGRLLASATSEGPIRVWDAATARLHRTLRGHGKLVASLAFFPDGDKLASGSDDRTIRMWNLATAQCVKTLKGHAGRPYVAISADGKRVISASFGGWVRVWDAATGRCERYFFSQCHSCYDVSLSPDGRRIVVCGRFDPALKVWDWAAGRCLSTVEARYGNAAVAFSPDGRWIASGGQYWRTVQVSRTLSFWDAATNAHVRTVEDHRAPISRLAFSPDGTRLATASFDGTVKIWALKPRSEVHTKPDAQ